MAANINTMMYAGQTPWHNQGVKVEGEQTAENAIKAAGLDWEVESVQMTHPYTLAPTSHYTVLRKDTGEIFANGMSKNYIPLQNRDAFSFVDSILDDGNAKYHTAGSLGNSSRIWLLAKFPGHIRIKNTDDLTEKFLLLSNTHDGKSSVRVMVTPIRVVCQNTLNAAMKSNNLKISINHSQKMNTRLDYAKNQLGIINDKWKKTEELYNFLASKLVNRAVVESIIGALVPMKNEEDMVNKFHQESMEYLFDDNDKNAFPEIAGTAWSLYNGITRYVDHFKAPHGNIENINKSRKTESILFGKDYDLKEKSMDLILQNIG